MRKLLCFSFFILSLFAAHAMAEQTQFKRQETSSGYQFSYQWRDQDYQPQRLQFTIARDAFMQMPASAAKFQPRLMQNSIKRELQQFAQSIDPRDATIRFTPSTTGFGIKVRSRTPGRAQEISEQLSELQASSESDYLLDNYLVRFQDQNMRDLLRPAHERYAMESTEALHAIVEKIRGIMADPSNTRDFIAKTLSWLQSIPYDTLENRQVSNGAGFASPRDLLLANKGDCDSKSTFMAALLKAFDPNLNVAIIYLPQHALVAVGMLPLNEEAVLYHQQAPFIMFEPTGPAYLPFGEIDPQSNRAIINRQYTVNVVN